MSKRKSKGGTICRRVAQLDDTSRCAFAVEEYFALWRECLARVSEGEGDCMDRARTQRLLGIHAAWEGRLHVDVPFGASGPISVSPMTAVQIAHSCLAHMDEIGPDLTVT